MHSRNGVDSWPKITAPRTPAVEHANAIIAAMNQQSLETFWDCDAKADWVRKITVTMRGPRFVAMTEDETLFCGNAYPYNDHAAVVLDMKTGEPVDWKDFMNGVEGASARSDRSIDGAISSEVVVPSLTELAIRRAGPECKKVLEESGALVFQLWPDAKRGQLMMKATGQPHVTQACEEIIGLSVLEAGKLGFSSEILGAIQQAHRIENSAQKKVISVPSASGKFAILGVRRATADPSLFRMTAGKCSEVCGNGIAVGQSATLTLCDLHLAGVGSLPEGRRG